MVIHSKASIRWDIRPEDLVPKMKKLLEKGFEKCADLAVVDAKRRAPKGESGKLAKSIEAIQVSATGFRIIARAPYSIYLELGTRTHMIRPVKKQALHWKDGRKDRFSKGHMVSGIKASPFIYPAVYNNVDKFTSILQKEMQGLK
jgi:hypothetical protein